MKREKGKGKREKGLALQQPPDAFLRAPAYGLGERFGSGFAAETDGLPEAVYHTGTVGAFPAVPFDRLAFRRPELAIEIGGNAGKQRPAPRI
jgi:hypothetical protein